MSYDLGPNKEKLPPPCDSLMNMSSYERRGSSARASSSSSSHPSQDSSRPSVLATSHSQGEDRTDDYCSLPNNPRHRNQHAEGGQYDHLNLAQLLQQYQQQQRLELEQQQQQQQQSGSILPSVEAGSASIAATLPFGRDGTHSSSISINKTSVEALAATAEASAPSTFDLSEFSTTNPHVQVTPRYAYETAAATTTAGMMPNGIAGTAHYSLFESGQKPQTPLQYLIQQSHSTEWPAFRQSRSFGASTSSHSSLTTHPFSFHTAFPTFERNKAMIERALHQMQQVLDAIPLLQKMEYAVALRMAPHLVRLESDPTRFLRYTNWDVQAAAHKLVAYWKRRVAIFGQDRAYLPLTLWALSAKTAGSTSHGATESALSKEEVALINEGFIAYAAHPPFAAGSTVADNGSNKTVVIFDASRRNSDAWDVHLRAFFYHAHCIAENPVSQTEGFVVLCIVQSPQYYDHHTMECLSMILDTFPSRLKEWHIFDCSSMALPSLSLSPSSASSALLGQGYLFAYFEMFLYVSNEYTTYHYSVGDHSPHASSSSTSSSSKSIRTKIFSPDEIRWELETEHELTADEIPALLGGCWTYDAFKTWMRERMHCERSRYFEGNHGNVDTLQGSVMQDDQNTNNRAGLMTNVACDTLRHGGRHPYGMGRSSKRSKRDRYLGEERSCDRMVDSDKQQEVEGEEDGTLDDLMEQFDQLFFRDSPSPEVLPESSAFAWPTNAHASLRRHSSESGIPGHWQQQHEHLAVSPFMSRMNHFHPVVLLEKALDAIPMNDKVAFLTAMQVAPRLVAHESDPMRFLVFHDFDAQRAAERLVYYWKIRHEWFGDRAYLPMVLFSLDGDEARSGGGNDGALTAEDISLVRTGFIRTAGTDRQGSPVFIVDTSRRNTTAAAVRLRASFYAFQVLSEDHTGQTLGAVGIVVMHGHNVDRVSLKSMQTASKIFPIKAKAVHSFDCMERNNNFHRGFIQGLLGTFVRFVTMTKVHFHTSQCQQERERNIRILEEEHGMNRDLLPCSIGGTWTYEQFDEWLIQRSQEEKRLHLFNAHMNDRSHAFASDSTNSLPASAPNSMTGNQPPGADFRSVPIAEEPKADDKVPVAEEPEVDDKVPVAEEPKIDDDTASFMPTDLHNIPENLQYLERATRQLSTLETQSFKEALQNAKPQIWEEESNPELFLRVEKLDIQKAGERMAKYWQLRAQTFEPKQFDLLTQTGEDALGRRELKALATGFLTLLPTDTNGQSVLFVDLSRLHGNVSSSDCNRCLFYMMSLLTENDKSQTDGAILLHSVHSPDFALIDVAFLEMLVKALPLKLSRIHLISYDTIPVDAVLSRVRCGSEVYIHSGTGKETLCSELELFGMKKAGLPKAVNGDWGYEKFVQWQELRTRIEWKIPAGLSGRDSTDMASFPAMKPYTIVEEVKERQRRLNLIRFRRRQNRDRVDIAMLQENCFELENEQKKLLEENSDLETRYVQASAIVNGEK